MQRQDGKRGGGREEGVQKQKEMKSLLRKPEGIDGEVLLGLPCGGGEAVDPLPKQKSG